MNLVSFVSCCSGEVYLTVYNRFGQLLYSGCVHSFIERYEPMIDGFCINTINRISLDSDCIIVDLF